MALLPGIIVVGLLIEVVKVFGFYFFYSSWGIHRCIPSTNSQGNPLIPFVTNLELILLQNHKMSQSSYKLSQDDP